MYELVYELLESRYLTWKWSAKNCNVRKPFGTILEISRKQNDKKKSEVNNREILQIINDAGVILCRNRQWETPSEVENEKR